MEYFGSDVCGNGREALLPGAGKKRWQIIMPVPRKPLGPVLTSSGQLHFVASSDPQTERGIGLRQKTEKPKDREKQSDRRSIGSIVEQKYAREAVLRENAARSDARADNTASSARITRASSASPGKVAIAANAASQERLPTPALRATPPKRGTTTGAG